MLTFDNHAYGTTTTSALGFNHTISGTNTILILYFYLRNPGNSPAVSGTPTYGGTNMTVVQSRTSGSDAHYSYILVNPATGTNAVAVAFTTPAGTTTIWGYTLSYTASKQSAQPDANVNNTAVITSLSTNITTVANNSLVVAFAPNYDQNAYSSYSGITLRDTSNNWILVGDSNSVVSPAGSYNVTTATSPSSSTIYHNIISIAPIAITGILGGEI